MNSKVNPMRSPADTFLWLFIGILLLGGIIANFYFSDYAATVRVIGWIVLAAAAVGLAFQTQFGKTSWVFIKEARMEMRKVTWPNRQETVQTTLVVVVMVVIMALILWGIDTFLLWIIGTITGHTG